MLFSETPRGSQGCKPLSQASHTWPSSTYSLRFWALENGSDKAASTLDNMGVFALFFWIKKPRSPIYARPNQINSQVKRDLGVDFYTKYFLFLPARSLGTNWARGILRGNSCLNHMHSCAAAYTYPQSTPKVWISLFKVGGDGEHSSTKQDSSACSTPSVSPLALLWAPGLRKEGTNQKAGGTVAAASTSEQRGY